MKLHIRLSPNRTPVPFGYSYQLGGALHKWLGENNRWHGALSLYGYSWLSGSERGEDTQALYFPRGADWYIGFPEQEGVFNLLKGMMMDREVLCGMKIRDVREVEPPDFGLLHRFVANSPILLRDKREDGSHDHVLWTDSRADTLLTARIRRKLDDAGLVDERIHVAFDRDYAHPKQKVVHLKGQRLKCSVCPIEATGSPRALRFLWEVGAGELTGMGFGALR
jgi:CRISPR-associated endoribonuclease Cas6